MRVGGVVRSAELDAGSLSVEFSTSTESVSSVPVEFVLDLDAEGDVVGIEILHLQNQSGEALLRDWPPPTENPPRWSYDPEADAFYLRLTKERTVDQRAVIGQLLVDRSGRLAGLRAELGDKQ